MKQLQHVGDMLKAKDSSTYSQMFFLEVKVNKINRILFKYNEEKRQLISVYILYILMSFTKFFCNEHVLLYNDNKYCSFIL